MLEEIKFDVVDAKKSWKLAFVNISKETRCNSCIKPSTQILTNISGVVNPGEIMAILGLSGSGKTTLLSILSGRDCKYEGTVFVNAKKMDKICCRRIAYIQQQNNFISSNMLSTRDQLKFIALCRSNSAVTTTELNSHIDSILAQLNLSSVADAPIRLLSGGEMKRVSIACELMTNPKILLIDEGTSNLDSASTNAFIRLIKDIASRNSIPVVMSIHQPSARSFYSFHRILILVKGRVIFNGSPQQCQEYFCQNSKFLQFCWSSPPSPLPTTNASNCEIQRYARSNQNFAEDILEFIAKHKCLLHDEQISVDGDILESGVAVYATCIHNLADEWKNNGDCIVKQEIETSLHCNAESFSIFDFYSNRDLDNPIVLNPRSPPGEFDLAISETAKDTDSISSYLLTAVLCSQHICLVYRDLFVWSRPDENDYHLPSSFLRQTYAIALRSFRASGSSKFSMSVIFFTTATAVIIGFCWFQMDYQESRLIDICSLLTFYTAYFFFSGMKSGILNFINERQVYRMERASGSYYLGPFLVGRFSSILPTRLIQSILFISICYPVAIRKLFWLVYLKLIVIAFIAAIFGESIGILLASFSYSLDTTTNLGIVIALCSFFLGGFFIQQYPPWLSYLSRFSIYRQLYAIAVISFFTGELQFSCDGGISVPDCYGVEFVSSSVVIERMLHDAHPSIIRSIIILFIYFVVLNGLTYLSLRFIDGNVFKRR